MPPDIVNVRAYRPRQVMLTKGKPRKNTRHFAPLSPTQYRQLGLLVVAALVIGLRLTQFFHVRIVELRERVDQLQTSNITIAEKNDHLVAVDAQVAALAKRKLHLCEPDQRQVRRM